MISNYYEAIYGAGQQGGIVADQGAESIYQGRNKGGVQAHIYGSEHGVANPYSDIVN